MEFEVTKYNYNNYNKRKTILTINSNNTFNYLSKVNYNKSLKNIIGIILGPLTYTWQNVTPITKPYLCVSFVSHERTYDFKLDSVGDLKLLLMLTKNVNAYCTKREEYKLLHSYKLKYINHVIRYCRNNYNDNQHISREKFKEDLVLNWDFDNNKLKENNSLCIDNNIIDNIYNKEGCLICLEEFAVNQECILFDCNHLLHKECFDSYINVSKKEKKCVICHV